MPLLLLLLAAGGYWYYQQGKQFVSTYKIKFIDALFDSAKTAGAGFLKIYFTIRIEVSNVTDFTGTLQSAILNLWYNGKLIGVVNLPTPVTIARNGITKVEIPVAVPTVQIVNSVVEMIKAIGEGKGVTFNIKGNLNFTLGTVTVNENYKVPFIG